MKRISFAAAAVIVMAVTSLSGYATTVINIDFGLHGDHPSGPTSVAYSGAGAAFDPNGGTTWNNVEVVDNNAFTGAPGEFGWWSASVSQSNLLNSQGGATTLGVNVIGVGEPDTGAFGIVSTATGNLGAVATNARDLMRDYLIGFNAPRQVVLSGFTPAVLQGSTVDLYLYGAGDTSNRDTMFTVTDVNGMHSGTTTGTLTNDTNNPVAHTLTLGGDYIVLSGIVPDGAGNITIDYFHGAGSGEGPFNGLQAVYGVLPGDVNGDNHVTLADYQIIRDHFQMSGANRGIGDLTGPSGGNAGDGVVDFYDFAQWQQHFPSATANLAENLVGVPEPASVALALVACGGIARLRRRAK